MTGINAADMHANEASTVQMMSVRRAPMLSTSQNAAPGLHYYCNWLAASAMRFSMQISR